MRSGLLCLFVGFAAAAQVPARSFFTLPSSNGHTAVMVDAQAAKITHWRERLAATEEPLLDATGKEVFVGNQPQAIDSRDLVFDDYFGLRAGGSQQWLTSVSPSSSGYSPASAVVTFTQSAYGLDLTTYVFAPRALPAAGFVKVLCAKNSGAAAVTGVSVFTLDNFHLGFGRPGVMTPLDTNGESVTVTNTNDVQERAFAGLVVTRPLGATTVTAWNSTTPAAQNGFDIVQNTTGDFPAVVGSLGTQTDWVTGLQFNLGDLAAGAQQCVGSVSVHHGNPFGDAEATAWLDAYVGTQSARQLVDAELAAWAAFQQSLTVPPGLSSDEQTVLRQSTVVLEMAQTHDSSDYLREYLSMDGEPRYTRFLDGGTLPAQVQHKGNGAILASLPPGEWTYAWVRDGAYSAVAMAQLGLAQESRAQLEFLLDAEGGRFQSWNELSGYGLLPYQVSLVRYMGFGVEQTDENTFGPNFEFDGFGLTLWALRAREDATQDTTLVDAHWDTIATKIADPLVALIDPATGLLRGDSSIWETHWNGHQRQWTYSNLAAVRGLCDAAALSTRKGDAVRAQKYQTAAKALRRAMAAKLTDASHALASNAEELAAGEGYYDAAVAEAIALGLFAPDAGIAAGTLDALDAKLRVTAGPGWARNDDLTDHGGGNDLSPWGSDYDSAEWVFTDMRGAISMRLAGRVARADALLAWTTSQSVQNAGLITETYDPASGAWKFNAPMVGFGAGAYVLALQQRAAGAVAPACEVFFENETSTDGGSGGGSGGGGGTGVGGGAGGGSGGGSGGSGGGGGFVVETGGGGGTLGSHHPSSCGCSSLDALPVFALGVFIFWRRRK